MLIPDDTIVRRSSSGSYVAYGGEIRLSNAAQLALVKGVMARGVSLRLEARGSSMVPFIRDGDFIILEPTDRSGLHVGDIVAFEVPDARRMVVHRLVTRCSAGWVARGDFCTHSDGFVRADLILGRVNDVRRRGRRVRVGLTFGRWPIGLLSRTGTLFHVCRAGLAIHRAVAGVTKGGS